MESHQPPEVGPFHSDVSRLVLLHHQAIPAQQTTHRIRYTGSGQGSFNSLRHHRGAGSMSCPNRECRATHSARTKPGSKSCAGVELLKTCTESQPGEDGVNATHPHQPHQSLWRPSWSPSLGIFVSPKRVTVHRGTTPAADSCGLGAHIHLYLHASSTVGSSGLEF